MGRRPLQSFVVQGGHPTRSQAARRAGPTQVQASPCRLGHHPGRVGVQSRDLPRAIVRPELAAGGYARAVRNRSVRVCVNEAPGAASQPGTYLRHPCLRGCGRRGCLAHAPAAGLGHRDEGVGGERLARRGAARRGARGEGTACWGSAAAEAGAHLVLARNAGAQLGLPAGPQQAQEREGGGGGFEGKEAREGREGRQSRVEAQMLASTLADIDLMLVRQ